VKIVSYLNFDGDCEEAMRFYAGLLGGEIVAMFPFRGTPAEEFVQEECKDQIMHATLHVGDQILMASDAPSDRVEQPQGFAVTLLVDTPAEGERLFNALTEGGSVTMPYQATFWSAGFGMVTDRFGTPWMINCEQAA
jgi:PhnB protein